MQIREIKIKFLKVELNVKSKLLEIDCHKKFQSWGLSSDGKPLSKQRKLL